MNIKIEHKEINNKSVYIFEKHHEAIIPWQKISLNLTQKPALITLDCHMDTSLALLNYTYHKLRIVKNYQGQIQKVNEILSQPYDINQMVQKLKHDEQIDFAIRANFISHAYVISHFTDPQSTMKSLEEKKWSNEKNKPENKFTFNIPKPIDVNYVLPDNKIIELDNNIFHSLDIYDEKLKKNLAIEDIILHYKINKIQTINCSIFGKNYNFLDNFILDIDLDYFNTIDSINPQNKSIFYNLIRHAKAISIAKESSFVEELKLDNELSVDFLLKKLLVHIELALSVK